MKEIINLSVNERHASSLFKDDEGRKENSWIRVVQITRDDPRWLRIPKVNRRIRRIYGEAFYQGWKIKYEYENDELEKAALLHLIDIPQYLFFGEEYGTLYDDTKACPICGVHAVQVNDLHVRKSRLPKKDIACTLAGEVIVSERFAEIVKRRELRGIVLKPIYSGKNRTSSYQVFASSEVELSERTVVGPHPFTSGVGNDGVKRYKCPLKHSLSSNILSELHVIADSVREGLDFYATKQQVGGRCGLLRPHSLYLCSQRFRQVMEEEGVKGFGLERVWVEEDEHSPAPIGENPWGFGYAKVFEGGLSVEYRDVKPLGRFRPLIGFLSVNGKLIKGDEWGGPCLFHEGMLYLAKVKRSLLLPHGFALYRLDPVSLKRTALTPKKKVVWLDKIEGGRVYYYTDIERKNHEWVEL